jgi:hypothetical protein
MREPALLVTDLLEDVARRVSEAGASLIGHLKCHARADGGRSFRANLTSLRSGARTAGDPVPATEALEIDLVVLAYGLDRADVEKAVRDAVSALEERAGSHWTMGAQHRHDDGDHQGDPH